MYVLVWGAAFHIFYMLIQNTCKSTIHVPCHALKMGCPFGKPQIWKCL